MSYKPSNVCSAKPTWSKCRFLLGAGILFHHGLFWSYAHQTEGLAYDQVKTSARLLVPPILAREHLDSDRRDAINLFQQQTEKAQSEPLSEYRYKILKLDARLPEQKPEGDEVNVVNKLAADPGQTEVTVNQSNQGVFHYTASFAPRPVASSAATVRPPRPPGEPKPPLKEGDMMAVVKVTLSTKPSRPVPTSTALLLCIFAIITAIPHHDRQLPDYPLRGGQAGQAPASRLDAIVARQLNVLGIHTGDGVQRTSGDAYTA